MSDRVVRFCESSWQEVEALPEPLRWTVQRAGYQPANWPDDFAATTLSLVTPT